ncbi:DMT family transporter [Nioella sp. MMSF_3534]|uniref:DMT family transporter n=1 Tax=Nioella sp. MMSF_3534 TaxID=3046720 RepID=UPI00273F576A|nr:DMT family transporter [Nioella sp. MMSF_3534]
MSDYAKGLWLTLTGVLILSPDVLLIRLAGLPEWTLMFWRGAGMGGVIALWLLVTQGRGAIAAFKGVGLAGLAIGLSYTLGNVSFLYSVGHKLAANTLFILATMPVFSALIARFVLGQPVPGRTWVTIAAVLFGIGIIAMGSAGGGQGDLMGDLAAVVTALSWAVIFAIAGQKKTLSMVPAMSIAGFFAMFVSLLLAPGLSMSAASVPFVALIALIVTPGATALLSLGPRYLPPADVSLIMLLEAVFGPILVWLVLAEFPGLWTLAGGAVVLGALTLNNLAALRVQNRG